MPRSLGWVWWPAATLTALSLDQLKSFVAVAEHGSVSAAARAIHLSQAPVTRQLLALEDELRVRLSERRPRGMALTAQGEALLPLVREALAAVNRVAAILGFHPRGKKPDQARPPESS